MHTADRLGAIKSAIAALRKEHDVLAAEVISRAADHPGDAYAEDGDAFRACVSWVDRSVTDYRAALADLADEFDISTERLERALRKHTRVAPQVPQVRVSARKVAA